MRLFELPFSAGSHSMKHHESPRNEAVIRSFVSCGPAQPLLAERFGAEMAATGNGAGATAFAAGMATDIGGRAQNQDSAVALVAESSNGRETYPIVFAAIADGMGGQPFGDEASAVTIRAMTETIVNWLMLPQKNKRGHGYDADTIGQVMREAIIEANHNVLIDAPGGGTTITCLLLRGLHAFVAHVGDSRAYLIDESGPQVLTRDHLLVRRLEELGQITHEQAARHTQRHYLYRAIGMPDEVEADFTHRPIPSGSALVLCSDGVWDALGDDVIGHMAGSGSDPNAICSAMVRAAISAGTGDNATAVLIKVPEVWSGV